MAEIASPHLRPTTAQINGIGTTIDWHTCIFLHKHRQFVNLRTFQDSDRGQRIEIRRRV